MVKNFTEYVLSQSPPVFSSSWNENISDVSVKLYLVAVHCEQGWQEAEWIPSPLFQINAEESPCCFCLFFFLSFAGHTSSSPTAYSPSHTETNSSGVPLIRTSVRTWFLLHAGGLCLNYLPCCVHKVTYGTLKGDTTCTGVSSWAELFVETVASLWRKKMWRFALSEGQWTQGSVCGYLWLINITCIFEGLLDWELTLQADITSSSWWLLDIVPCFTVPSSLKENRVMFVKPDSHFCWSAYYSAVIIAKDIWM